MMAQPTLSVIFPESADSGCSFVAQTRQMDSMTASIVLTVCCIGMTRLRS